jgi:hypothetical protein
MTPWFEREPAALAQLERTLRDRFPTLHAFIEGDKCEVRGVFAAVAGDNYQISIELPNSYPVSLSVVFETGGRVPRVIDRHVFADGSLCLGVPLALWIVLRGDFRIEAILDGPLRSWLIGNSLVEEGEPWPHGDRPHGAAGILEHLGELIGSSDPFVAGHFLLDFLLGNVRGHWSCPCGSGTIIRKCHRQAVDVLRAAPPSILMHAVDTIHKDLKRLEQAAA